jgi:hypothetical protein
MEPLEAEARIRRTLQNFLRQPVEESQIALFLVGMELRLHLVQEAKALHLLHQARILIQCKPQPLLEKPLPQAEAVHRIRARA